MNQQNRLDQRVRKVLSIDPARNAIEFKDHWHSWQEMSASMNDLDRLLDGQGLGEGTAVGMALRNRPGHFSALLEVLISRRCMVTINPNVSTDKLVADLETLRVPVLVADAQDWENPALVDAARRTGTMGIALGGAEPMSAALVPGLESPRGGSHHEDLPGIAIQMLTSGTTGPSKRIKLEYKNFEQALLDALFFESGQGEEPTLRNSVVIALSPFVHIGGVWSAVSAIIAGRALCLLEKFSVEEWRAAVVKHRPKAVSMPPTAIRMILDANIPREDLASIIAFRSGTAPLDPKLQDEVEERYGIPVMDAYGATEFAGGVAGWTLGDYKTFGKQKRGSVGRAQPKCQLRIVDGESLSILPPNSIGLLEVQAAHINHGDWLRTTDLAVIDDDGFLFIRGRADDAIIRGGFKILPGEIVDLLKQHPAVLDASVVGLPDKRLGAVPVAAVELKNGASASPQELLDFLANKVARYQIPVALKIVDELPRTPSMKVAQPDVRKLFLQET